MRKWIGIVCLALSVCCLLGALGLGLYNRREADQAARASQELLQEVQEKIRAQEIVPGQNEKEMAVASVGDDPCVGILSIPALELQLPVLKDWSYAKLKKAPCLYHGSCYEKNFVIAAHNYDAHFGRLSELQAGDKVLFTDATGQTHHYEVILLETLPAKATEEMITSGFDLSLYTCTLGGSNRVTVRCSATDGRPN